ncbi:MAG: transcriptional repressor [Chloroflexi bacterium]|nr:transcriptional repressor [Chloroflexota bacterium]
MLTRLAKDGHRLTPPRQAIIDLVAARTDHFSAQEIWDDVRERGVVVGRATVFRTLDLLAELGLLNRVHIGDGCHRYTVCETSHHHHLMCVVCGRVIPLETPNIEAQINQAAERAGFDLMTHHVELLGRCRECQVRGRPEPG